MEKFLNITVCLIFFVIVTFFYEDGFSKLYREISTTFEYQKSPSTWAHDALYIVDTPGCKIPNYDAFDLSIRKKIRPGQFETCDNNLSFVKLKRTCLEVDWGKVNISQYKDSFSHCRVHTIFRPRSGTPHGYFKYINETILTKKPLCLTSEMVRIQCLDKKNATIYTDFLWIYQRNEKIESQSEERLKNRKNNPNITETLSVLLLGVDSTSRLNSQRFLIKSRQALIQNLKAFEFKGHNIVGMDTFTNMVPMLVGKSIFELKKDGDFAKTPMDGFDFIWKDFEKNGYRTLYAEDAAWIALFDYFKPGFKTFPTHFFNRPWSVAWGAANQRCMNGRSEPHAIMEYLTKFVDENKSKPYFAFTFLTSLTHDNLELAAELDEVVYKFFHDAYNSNAFNNTIVFFFSDHGLRYGAIRSSDIGSYEVQSPVMFIAFPKWFSEKYPTIMKNLKSNTRKLTTVYDVHETLRNILNFSGHVIEYSSPERGESLFSDVSNTRNCSDVGVPDSMCTCSMYRKVVNFSPIVSKHNLSLTIVNKINKLLKGHMTLCETLSLYKTVSVYSANSTIKLHSYRIRIQTTPGKALFEAPVFYDSSRKKYQVGQILRINKYGDQSKCVKNYILRNYCFCKKQ